MNHKPIATSNLPKEKFWQEAYQRYAIVMTTGVIHTSVVSENDIMRHFKGNEPHRIVQYDPSKGRLFYITDLPTNNSNFWHDLFNKTCVHYEWAARMLDIITTKESDDQTSSDIDRRVARYEKWDNEVEFLDSILTNIRMEF